MSEKREFKASLVLAIVIVALLLGLSVHLTRPPAATAPVIPTEAAATATLQPSRSPSGFVTLWFDDGRSDTYSVAYPLLQRCDYRGVLAIIADRDAAVQKLAPENAILMSWEKVSELAKIGWEISSHSLTHSRLENLHGERLKQEIVQSKLELLNRGFEASVFTAPYGEWNEEGLDLASRYYRGYRTLKNGVNPVPVIDFKLLSYPMRSFTTRTEVQSWIRQAEKQHGWLIITIHTITNEPSNDWEISIDQFVDLLNSVGNSNLAVVTASEALSHPGFGEVTPIPEPTPTATPRPSIPPEMFSDTVILDIPTINVYAQIEVALPTDNGDELDFSRLHEVPLWVSYTREIGEPGVALVLGHRQWGPTPKVFARLDQLELGDIVRVVTEFHTFVYGVEEANVVINPAEVWGTVEKFDASTVETDTSALALLTCTPYGTDWQRLIVFAALEEVYEN